MFPDDHLLSNRMRRRRPVGDRTLRRVPCVDHHNSRDDSSPETEPSVPQKRGQPRSDRTPTPAVPGVHSRVTAKQRQPAPPQQQTIHFNGTSRASALPSGEQSGTQDHKSMRTPAQVPHSLRSRVVTDREVLRDRVERSASRAHLRRRGADPLVHRHRRRIPQLDLDQQRGQGSQSLRARLNLYLRLTATVYGVPDHPNQDPRPSIPAGSAATRRHTGARGRCLNGTWKTGRIER